MINGKKKGRRFEIWLARYLNKIFGDGSKAGDYYQMNATESPDVESPTLKELKIHPEAKAQEQPNVHQWMAQASGDAPKGFTPMVIWKKNQHEPLVVFPLSILERMKDEDLV